MPTCEPRMIGRLLVCLHACRIVATSATHYARPSTMASGTRGPNAGSLAQEAGSHQWACTWNRIFCIRLPLRGGLDLHPEQGDSQRYAQIPLFRPCLPLLPPSPMPQLHGRCLHWSLLAVAGCSGMLQCLATATSNFPSCPIAHDREHAHQCIPERLRSFYF
jgi:hypothetical protein